MKIQSLEFSSEIKLLEWEKQLFFSLIVYLDEMK